ncbi:MAG TPA: hypothetical protein VFZ29_02590 [Solirubrobacterales bacterium]
MRITGKLAVVLAISSLLMASVATGSALAAFGFTDFGVQYQESIDPTPPQIFEAGTKPPTQQAGSHADSVVKLDFNLVDFGQGPIPDEQVKNVQVDLPAGFAGNPEAVPTCRIIEMTENDGICNPAAQVGVLTFANEYNGFLDIEAPIYNMTATTADTAVLATEAFGSLLRINVSARTDGDYGLQATIRNVNQGLPLYWTEVTLWGLPAHETNDPLRFLDFFVGGADAGIDVKPFMSLPPRCDTPLTTTLYADSWQSPGRRNPDGSIDLSDPNWKSTSATLPALEGCDELEFEPSLTARPTTDMADSPSGLDATLTLPQNEDPEGLASAMLKTAKVTLPEGLAINPSAANGLAACSPAEIGLLTEVGAGSPRFDKDPAACPAASRIGSVEVDSVFADPLKGHVYVMEPYQNPLGDLLGIYVVVEGHGLVVKLAGKTEADPKTGQLTAVFDENPQLPFDSFSLKFEGGPLGILRTPQTCGTFATTATMVPWSSPDTPTVEDEDSWKVDRSPGGCAASASLLPSSPSFQAGTTPALAGAYAPFTLKLARGDGTQELTGIDAALPPGLLAKLAGTSYCSDSALSEAASRSGKSEQAKPSCPASSRVGSIVVGAGAGPRPFYAPGTAYLAGPYKGAPLSLAVVTPAVAGPFDLGTVVVRTALQVDPSTARVRAVSDSFPTILQGIPLDIRSVDLRLDRPDFTKNPTSCDPFAVAGLASVLSGQPTSLNSHFQVEGCQRLKFAPKLRLKLRGETKRSGNPALTAVLKARGGQANIAETTVILPKTQFIDNAHINNPCTRVQFNANACPAGSVLGRARAFTPLLDSPLEGPIYFRSNGGERDLPDMVVDLGGQIHITLVGFIDSVKVKGTENSRVRTRFVSIPDAPVSKFVLRLKGGKKGLIENSVNLCRVGAGAVSVGMRAHNSKTANFNRPMGTSCDKKR